jgi:hypothetical protein
MFLLGFITSILLIMILLKIYGKKILIKLLLDSMIKNIKIIYNSVGRTLTEKQLNELKNKMKY